MKYTQQGNCPYCDAERGISTAWGMHPTVMEELKSRHDNNHPENEQKSLTGNFVFCPKCGEKLPPTK